MFAGAYGLLESGLRVIEQIPQQPQIQRMDLGDIALVRQVVGAGAIALVQLGQALVGNFVAGQMRANKAVEGGLVGMGEEVAMHCRHADGGGVHAVQECVEAGLGVLAAVFLPELEHECGAFAVSESAQVFLAQRVAVVAEQVGVVAR